MLRQVLSDTSVCPNDLTHNSYLCSLSLHRSRRSLLSVFWDVCNGLEWVVWESWPSSCSGLAGLEPPWQTPVCLWSPSQHLWGFAGMGAGGGGGLAARSLVLAKGKPGWWQASREKCTGHLWRAGHRPVLHSNLTIFINFRGAYSLNHQFRF